MRLNCSEVGHTDEGQRPGDKLARVAASRSERALGLDGNDKARTQDKAVPMADQKRSPGSSLACEAGRAALFKRMTKRCDKFAP